MEDIFYPASHLFSCFLLLSSNYKNQPGLTKKEAESYFSLLSRIPPLFLKKMKYCTICLFSHITEIPQFTPYNLPHISCQSLSCYKNVTVTLDKSVTLETKVFPFSYLKITK